MDALNAQSYVPILGLRQGELRAWPHVDPSVRDGVRPLFEYQLRPGDRDAERDINRARLELHRSWGVDAPFYLDVSYDRTDRRRGMLGWVASALRMSHLQPILVVGPNAIPQDRRDLGEVTSSDNRGFCLRLRRNDFGDAEGLLRSTTLLLEATRLMPEHVDVLVDVDDVAGDDRFIGGTLPAVFAQIPHLGRWRAVILGCGAFPDGGLTLNELTRFPRLDFDLWDAARNRLPRTPVFADYGASTPGQTPAGFRGVPNIRYTAIGEWVVARGWNTRDRGQYQDLCRRLLEDPAYSGRGYSWADTYIADCANQAAPESTSTRWVSVRTCRHVTFVVNQLRSVA